MTEKEIRMDENGKVLHYDLDDAIKVLEAPLEKSWIKQRQAGGGRVLDYIEGARVIELLNKAFNYQWDFEILDMQIIQAEPWKNQEQGKYAQVKARITVPGLAYKEAVGSKAIIGRTSEQESVFKAAMTDALKKAATLFGIGRELYLDDVDEVTPNKTNYNNKQAQKQHEQQRPQYDPNDVNTLKEYKAVLGITNNSELDPYIKDWSGGKLNNFKDITPTNIKALNAYLKTKV